ncbi:hypothetical protein SNEBB_010694 [Seison nebaliae]|nr:hypothetical protein SNEBB_010694 [Seison nebaliae]
MIWRRTLSYGAGISLIKLPVIQAISQESLKPKIEEEEIPRKIIKSSHLRALVENRINEETAKDRLNKFISKDGELKEQYHPDLLQIHENSHSIAFFGFVAGAMSRLAEKNEMFAKTHAVTIYRNVYNAKRSIIDYIFIQMISGGIHYAIKFYVLSGLTLLSGEMMAKYNNRTSVIDYIPGGIIGGMVLRLINGWRATIVGGIFGLVIGLVVGIANYSLRTFTNNLEEERKYREVENRILQKNYWRKIEDDEERP